MSKSRNLKAEASWHRNRMKGSIKYAAGFLDSLSHNEGFLTIDEMDIIKTCRNKLRKLIDKESWKNYNDFVVEGSYYTHNKDIIEDDSRQQINNTRNRELWYSY